MAETLADRVKRLREDQRLTQDALGRLAGVTGQAIYQIESRPNRRPQRETIRRLAVALGVSPVYLETGYEPDHDGTQLPPELLEAYRGLGPFERRALLQNARTLRDIQAEYAALTEHEERRVAEDEAAYDNEAEADEVKRDTEDFEPR